jgi:transcriptional regulator with XRE-family HTH domain
MLKSTTFAVNLQRLVADHGGVSKVAAALGVNRTQFHRYVSGTAMPRPTLIRQMATYFNVTETSLFLRISDTKIESPPFNMLAHPLFKSIVADIESSSARTMAEGRYLTYFHVSSDEGMVVRALTFVTNLGAQTVFMRLTGAREPNGSRWRFSRGRHVGTIIESRGNQFFIGYERGTTRQPSLLVMKVAQTGRPIFVGQGLVTARNGPAVASVVMEPLSRGLSLPDSLRLCTTVSIRDRSLDADVRILLREQLAE